MPIEEFQYLLGETSFFLPWILGGCRDGDIGWSEIADMQAAAQEEISVLLAAEDGQKLYKSYWQKKTAAGEEPLSFADFQTALQTDSDFVTSLPSCMASEE